MSGLGGAPAIIDVPPLAPHHKESLCIYKLHTDYPFLKITRFLNHKYQHKLPDGHRFSPRLVEKTWDRMVEEGDEIYIKVKGWDIDYWRVERVLEWAERDDVKRPL